MRRGARSIQDGIMSFYCIRGYLHPRMLNLNLKTRILVGGKSDGESEGRIRNNHPFPLRESFIGPGHALDTNRFFIICTNVLGGCNGSTGPSSINPL